MQSVDGYETKEEARNIALEITKVTPPTPQIDSSTNSLASSEIRISPAKVEELSSELTTKITSKPKSIKARRERNVAIASLLKVHAGVAPNGYVTPKESITKVKSPVKLLKPEDFAVSVNRATQQLNESAKELYEYNTMLNQPAEHESTTHLKQPSKSKQCSTEQLNPSAKNMNPCAKDVNPPAKNVNPSVKQLNPSAKPFNASAKNLNQPTKLVNQPPTRLNLPALQLDQQTNIEKVDQWLKEGIQSSRIGPLSADCFKFKKSQKTPAKPIGE